MDVQIRKFNEKDIKNKIKWINDSRNNQYLHYDLPLEFEKTKKWYQNSKNRNDRYDAVIEVNGKPVGLIGLLSINMLKRDAEFYIAMGNVEYKGKGVSKLASKKIIEYAFNDLKLEEVYLFTEVDNTVAQRMFESVGFSSRKLLKNDVSKNDGSIDRYFYKICKKKQETDTLSKVNSVVNKLSLSLNDNNFYIMREDLLPKSFGGNKLRKALLFFEDLKDKGANCVVTYGSSSSNHCRVVSNLASEQEIPCFIISPNEKKEEINYNQKLMSLSGAEVIYCETNEVKNTINQTLQNLKNNNFKPYFIEGGGHGDIGTQAYVEAFNQIIEFENKRSIKFDYIFHASGTGTTQAGLICGAYLNKSNVDIIGISVARKNPRGAQIILDSVINYCTDKGINYQDNLPSINFCDEYIVNGYGSCNSEINKSIKKMYIKEGIPLDSTYTGKAFWGMESYIKKKEIKNKNILFIHTGGTPLFFNSIDGIKEGEG